LIVAGIVWLVVCLILTQNADLGGDAQLKILREMKPYWDRTESGGIVLLVNQPTNKRWVPIGRWLGYQPMGAAIPSSARNGRQHSPRSSISWLAFLRMLIWNRGLTHSQILTIR